MVAANRLFPEPEPAHHTKTGAVLAQAANELSETKDAMRRLLWENQCLRDSALEDAKARDNERTRYEREKADLVDRIENLTQAYRELPERGAWRSVLYAVGCVALGVVLTLCVGK